MSVCRFLNNKYSLESVNEAKEIDKREHPERVYRLMYTRCGTESERWEISHLLGKLKGSGKLSFKF